MWKLISLSALLIVAQAANINDFYGDWIQVAFYPVSTYAPVCIRWSIEKGLENVRCVYADGRNATTVQVSMMTEVGKLAQHVTIPMMVVDTAAEVMPALNISCRCGDKDFRNRAVARLVNDDYFIMYSNIEPSMGSTRTDIEQNFAQLLAREVVSAGELYGFMSTIEDLKNRQGAVLCVTENYSGFNSSENKVL